MSEIAPRKPNERFCYNCGGGHWTMNCPRVDVAPLSEADKIREAVQKVHDGLAFDLKKMITFGPHYNQAVKDGLRKLYLLGVPEDTAP